MTLWNIHVSTGTHLHICIWILHTCTREVNYTDTECYLQQQTVEASWKRMNIPLYPSLHTSECVLTVLECEERPGPWLSHAVMYVGIRWMAWVVVNSLPQTHADDSTHTYCICFTKPSTTFILQATHAGVRKAHYERAARTLECGFNSYNELRHESTYLHTFFNWRCGMDTCNTCQHVLHVLYWTVHSTFKPISITVNIFIDKLIEASIWWLLRQAKKECSQHSYKLQRHSAIFNHS